MFILISGEGIKMIKTKSIVQSHEFGDGEAIVMYRQEDCLSVEHEFLGASMAKTEFPMYEFVTALNYYHVLKDNVAVERVGV